MPYTQTSPADFARRGSLNPDFYLSIDGTAGSYVSKSEGTPPPPNGSTSGSASIKVQFPAGVASYDGIGYFLNHSGVNTDLGNYQEAKIWVRVTPVGTPGSAPRNAFSLYLCNQAIDNLVPNNCYMLRITFPITVFGVQMGKRVNATDYTFTTYTATDFTDLIWYEVVFEKISATLKYTITDINGNIFHTATATDTTFSNGGAGWAIWSIGGTTRAQDFWVDYFRANKNIVA